MVEILQQRTEKNSKKEVKPYVAPNFVQEENNEDLPDLDEAYGDEKKTNKWKNAKEKVSENMMLEKENFRVESKDWTNIKEISSDFGKIVVKVNPAWDIFEYKECSYAPELVGEQLFTRNAALRETAKAGKRMPIINPPDDNDFEKIISIYPWSNIEEKYKQFLQDNNIKNCWYCKMTNTDSFGNPIYDIKNIDKYSGRANLWSGGEYIPKSSKKWIFNHQKTPWISSIGMSVVLGKNSKENVLKNPAYKGCAFSVRCFA